MQQLPVHLTLSNARNDGRETCFSGKYLCSTTKVKESEPPVWRGGRDSKLTSNDGCPLKRTGLPTLAGKPNGVPVATLGSHPAILSPKHHSGRDQCEPPTRWARCL